MLELIYDGSNQNHNADIVLIHGSTGDSKSTWTHASGAFWPTDFLAKEVGLRACRIWNFSYDAKPSTFLSNTELANTAKALVDGLAAKFVLPKFKNDGTVNIVAHGLGGIIAHRVRTYANEVELMKGKDVNLVLLGTPYFGSKGENRNPSEAQLEQVKRLGAVLGQEIADPAAAFRLWRKTASDIFPYAAIGSASYTKIASFREGLPFDDQGVIVREEHSMFDDKDILNCHPGNIDLIQAHGYRIDTNPIQFKIQASHADLGRFQSARDDGYISIYKVLAMYHYYGGVKSAIAIQDARGEDWFG
ncbi:hypothetical protein GQ53DRAFT_837052 [Thozetella sp. PMI_491]|nr:hypothetical protein GQ53DRAFT_837052 [Thozetella sp. PMI_491]